MYKYHEESCSGTSTKCHAMVPPEHTLLKHLTGQSATAHHVFASSNHFRLTSNKQCKCSLTHYSYTYLYTRVLCYHTAM